VWFAALVGPTAVPMILGLLPAFRRCRAGAAVSAWVAGIVTFAIVKYGTAPSMTMTMTLAAPVMASAAVYIAGGWLRSSAAPAPSVVKLFDVLDSGRSHEK
jgi:SSS family solute:Na+ symporter